MSPSWASMRDWDGLRDVFFHVVAADAAIPQGGMPLAIAQDGAGFIWVGTDVGVNRWDGKSFRTFTADGLPGALPERGAKVVNADSAGRLWVGMRSEGLLRYDAGTERFVRPANRTPLDRERIFAIANGRDGAVWVASDGGIAKLDGHTLRVDYGVGRTAGLPQGAASAVAEDAHGMLWAVVGGQVFVRLAGNGNFRRFDLAGAASAGSSPVATSLFVDHAGRMWVSTASSGVFLIDSSGKLLRRILLRDGAAGTGQPMVTTAVEVRPDLIWLDSHEGIIQVDARTFAVRRLHHQPDRPGSLTDDSVNALLLDRSGLVWIGAASSLSIADPRAAAAVGVQSALGEGAGKRPYRAWAVSVAPDGHIWLGAEDDPVRILDPGGGTRAKAWLTPEGSPRGATSFAFPRGRGAYAAGETGLFHMGAYGRVFRRVSDAPVRRLLVAGDILYVGGPDGLSKMDLRREHTTLTPALDAGRLTDPKVTTLLAAPDGILWIGTAHGLNRFDPRTGKIAKFPPNVNDPRAPSANYVNSLMFDRRGRLWIAMSDGGINVLENDPRGGSHFRRLARADGLPNDTVDMLLPGPDGSMWASTDGGIVRIDPATFAMRTLREAEGAHSLAHWEGGGDTAANGDMIFAGTSGLTIVDPAIGRAKAASYPLVATQIRVGTRTLSPGAALRSTGIEIPPGVGSVAVEFSALDFAAPDRISYAYRLKGFETAWTRADAANRVARYTNLAPGNYVLELRASQRDGAFPGGALDIPVRVAAAWHQTWVFRGAVLLTVLIGCWGVMQLRVRMLRRRERALEAVIEKRTAELQTSQSELKKLAYFDALTGLANRRMFTQNMQRLLSPTGRQAPAFALILIDLDKFKTVNDTQGHDAGDALLIEAAGRLVSSVRESDSVARLGGDEFAILVAGCVDANSLSILCGRVIEAVGCPIVFADRSIDTSASLGVALFPDHGQTQDELYKAADLALYAAKRGGRNTWRLFSDVVAEADFAPQGK